MNCATCQELLQRRLDGEVIEQPDLDRHLAQCVDCRALEHAGRRLLQGLSCLDRPQVPALLAERIARRVVVDRRVRQRRRVVTTLALAASVLLAFGVLALWPTPAPRVPEIAEKDSLRPAPELRESVAQAGSAVVALTTRAADEAVEPARELLPVLAGPMLAEMDLNPIVEAPAVALNDAGQGLKAGFEPMTSSARRAVGLFLRDLTPSEPESKPGL